MTIINIERVNNGWIVRPHDPAPYGCCAVASAVFVYTTVADLQAALPELLEYKPEYPTRVTNNPS